MTLPKVLQLGNIEHAQDTWSALSQVAEVITPKATNRAEFLAECKSGALDGVVAIYRTFASVRITGRIDADLVAALPSTVRFICHCGRSSFSPCPPPSLPPFSIPMTKVKKKTELTRRLKGAGYDQIDIPSCTSRVPPVLVSNTPTAVDDATADINIWLIIGTLRNLNASILSLREGKWRGDPAPPLGRDPQGKVLGILGMGGIGRNVAKKARVFGMRVRYFNRTRLAPELEADCGAEYVDFETLLKESDVVSLNLPLNAHTRHIISTPQFALMKKGVVIVNTARGAVMDEGALVEALDSGHVASAGLDVFEKEPQVHPGLLANPNVLIVPHMGTWTLETSIKMEEWAIGNVRRAVTEERLNSVVPEQRDVVG
ncbi:putative 2-hydroxyacid dehydrogenase UNK4.10 [Colletotrichum chlorophyti]|uniref:Putative 2-hydroxyacid dehydrogenase UNK4.10 n=1 Tax=Colletotrichum chlorophyti TaxID=708187 RepID=A0A1Q8RUI9_9PEZI|nr:putative 2-hydroxyacid dehydrogenase UNK4.10 [Colletotrichum chlorophyti]